MSEDPGATTEYVEDGASERGMPWLELVRGLGPRPPVHLAPGSLVIGRDAAADVALAIEGVSRKHARLTIAGDGAAEIVDLSSRNGTFVNGRRIEREVLRDADELRIGPVVLRLRYLADRAGPGEVTARPDLPLSARELEVAELVASGLTNAEIGKRLHISPATVGRHLSNVYERLDIHSRAALVARLAGGPTRPR